MQLPPNPQLWSARAADRWPDRVALLTPNGDALSFRQLESELERLARVVAAEDPGSVLALALDSVLITALVCLAVPRIGVVPFPINRRLPAAQREVLLAQAGVRTLISEPDMQLAKGVRRLAPEQLALVLPAALDRVQAGDDDLQLILATSGSGGQPKGVMLSGANLGAASTAFLARWTLGPGDLWLDCLPLFHIGGLAILFRCLAAGATVSLHQGFNAERVWDELQRGRVSHVSLVPAMLGRLLDIAGDAPPPTRLRMLLLGGAFLSPELAERARRAGWPLCVSYGMTETSALCAADCGGEAGVEPGLVGKLLDGISIAGGAPEAAPARLKLRGATVMVGYANPRLERGRGLDAGWFKTADLGSVDDSGRLRVFGRVDQVLVSGGELVCPEQVELGLAGCPGVRAVAVGGVPDSCWGDLLVAWYQGSPEPDELEAWSRERLPAFMRPRRFRRVESLPETAAAKLDRARLRELMAAWVSA